MILKTRSIKVQAEQFIGQPVLGMCLAPRCLATIPHYHGASGVAVAVMPGQWMVLDLGKGHKFTLDPDAAAVLLRDNDRMKAEERRVSDPVDGQTYIPGALPEAEVERLAKAGVNIVPVTPEWPEDIGKGLIKAKEIVKDIEETIAGALKTVEEEKILAAIKEWQRDPGHHGVDLAAPIAGGLKPSPGEVAEPWRTAKIVSVTEIPPVGVQTSELDDDLLDPFGPDLTAERAQQEREIATAFNLPAELLCGSPGTMEDGAGSDQEASEDPGPQDRAEEPPQTPVVLPPEEFTRLNSVTDLPESTRVDWPAIEKMQNYLSFCDAQLKGSRKSQDPQRSPAGRKSSPITR